MAGLDTETSSLEYKADQIAGVCVSGGVDYSPQGYAGYYIPERHIGYSANLPVEAVSDFVQWLIDDFQTVLFNRNFDTSMLEYDGVKIPFVGGMHDAQIMAYSVFNEAYPSLKDYSRRFLKWDMIDFAENKAKDHNFKTTDPTVSYIYAAGDPIATVFLARKLWNTYPYIRKIYKIDNYCLEAVRRLCQNELTLDYDFLEALRDETERHLAEIRTKIYSMSGVYGFNIDSSREKADVLSRFVTLTEKTKSGKFKTDEEALRRLNHPIANLMIDYAQTRVFLKSFVAKMCTYKGRVIRANYNTVNVPSGRLSSGASEGNPYFVPQNMQNCPKEEEKLYLHHHPKIGYVLLREEEGCVRNAKGEPVKYKTKTGLHRAFIPHDKDWVIMSSDYASQELRLAANFSRDPNLLEPLLKGEDIHMYVAKQMFGYEDPLHRTKVKVINFSALYGAEYPTVSARLGIPLQEGKTLMTRYKQTMSKLYAWKAEIVKAAKKRGYALTYFGRPVYLLKYFNSPDRGMSAYAERLAVNATIQGPVTPDTPVLLEDGYHLMKDIPEQGRCATGNSFARYVKVFSGVQPILELEFEDGSILKCSKEHRLMSVQPSGLKWMEASEIVEGTPIASHTSSVEGSPILFDLSDQGVKAVKVSSEINNRVEETLYWTGRAFGDGSFLESGVIHWVFGNHEREDRDRLVKWGNALGLHVNLQEFSKEKDKSRRGDCLRATISSKNLCKLLKQIGVRFGVNSHDKRIPSRVFTASFEQKRQFVKGLFDSDGSKNWGWGWHMCNGDLLHDMQTLLWSMGVFSRWHKYKGDYTLNITSLKEFAQLVGREHLRSRCQFSNTLVPDYMASRFIEKYASGELSYFRKGILPTDRAIMYKLRNYQPVGYLKFIELCDRFGWDVRKEEDFYFYKKVKSIRALGESEVYCLSVEDPSHQFITNGVVSHNCILADTFAPSQDGKVISTLRNLVGKRVQFAKDERGTAHKGVPVFRGKLPCAMVEFLSGDFIMVSTNHKFLKYKSNTLLSIEEAAADAVQFVKPHKKVKLFKAILNTLLGRFKGTTLNSLAVFPRHDKPADSVEIATALFRAFIRDEHLITYNPVLAHSVRSLVDLYGYNLVKVCSGRYALSWSRAKKSKVCFVDNLKGTYDVMSPTMISGFQTYPLSGMIHKNTGADLMRLFLIKFTKLNIDDKDWRENTRMILPVHDEMNLEVSIPYMREAWLKMRKVMNFFPENFAVPIVVDTGVGTSWGNCLDVECISPKGRVVPKDIDPDDFSGEERAYLQEILEECVFEELPDRLKKFVKC